MSLVTARTSGAAGFSVPWEVLTPLHLLLMIGTAACLGFTYGILGAVVYNFVARWTGGIEIEL